MVIAASGPVSTIWSASDVLVDSVIGVTIRPDVTFPPSSNWLVDTDVWVYPNVLPDVAPVIDEPSLVESVATPFIEDGIVLFSTKSSLLDSVSVNV